MGCRPGWLRSRSRHCFRWTRPRPSRARIDAGASTSTGASGTRTTPAATCTGAGTATTRPRRRPRHRRPHPSTHRSTRRSPRPSNRRPSRAASLPTAASLHLANRFTYGFTPGLHEQMTAAGSPDVLVRGPAEPRRHRRREGECAPVVVALDRPRRRRHLAARPVQGRAELGGDAELRPLVPAAPHLLPAAGAGGDDRVLGEPPPRAPRRLRRLHLSRRLRQAPAPPRARAVRRDARRCDHPSRHGHLAGQRPVDEEGAQREPRPRAPRAAHRRSRQPHRGRREELRPHPHRLPGGHVDGHLERLLPHRPATGPVRSTSSASPTPTPIRTGERSPRPT